MGGWGGGDKKPSLGWVGRWAQAPGSRDCARIPEMLCPEVGAGISRPWEAGFRAGGRWADRSRGVWVLRVIWAGPRDFWGRLLQFTPYTLPAPSPGQGSPWRAAAPPGASCSSSECCGPKPFPGQGGALRGSVHPTGSPGAQSLAREPLSRSRGGWELMSPVP